MRTVEFNTILKKEMPCFQSTKDNHTYTVHVSCMKLQIMFQFITGIITPVYSAKWLPIAANNVLMHMVYSPISM